MFISTGDFVRKHGPIILGVILAVSVGMGLLFTPASPLTGRRQSGGGLATIKGKPVDNSPEFQTVRYNVLASIELARGRQPVRNAAFEDDLNVRSLHEMVLLRKARELGIHVTDDEVVHQIRMLPIMLNDQKEFDPNRYSQYLIFLNNLNISESQFEDVIRQELLLAHLRALVSSTAEVTPAELQLSYNILEEPTTIDYVELNAADHKDTSAVTDEEARAYYDANQDKFRTPALVKVQYVYFTVSDAKKSVTIGDDDLNEYYQRNINRYIDATGQTNPLASVKEDLRKELLDLRAERLTGDRATAFTVKLVPQSGGPTPDFAKIAAEEGLTVKETDFFDLQGAVKGVEAGPEFNKAAFSLAPDVPVSDPVPGKDGYYVLDYVASRASGVPPFDEVKAQAVERIRQQRAYDATIKHGRELDDKIKAAVAAGRSFADACKSFGLTVKSPGSFTFVETVTNLPFASTIKEIALGMPTNAVSDFLTAPTGGIIIHLHGRQPPKPLQPDSQGGKMLDAQLLQQNREALFEDWAISLMRAEQVEYKRRARPAQQPPATGETEPAEQPAPAPAS
jgi:hypothetical protein